MDGLDPKHQSRALTEGPTGRRRARYLKGIGYDDEALAKPIIGVANTWIETMPCNFDLRAPRRAGQGGHPRRRRHAAWSSTRSPSPTASRMGTEGMKASLISREVIADSIELVARGHLLRRRSSRIAACDKTIPGAVDGAGPAQPARRGPLRRLHPARAASRASDVTDPGRLRGRRRVRRRQDDRRRSCTSSRSVACPGAGACGGQYTANTMAMAIEILGMSLDGQRARSRRIDPHKDDVAFEVGKRWSMDVLRARHPPARHHHAQSPRERDRRRRRHRRLDQRRAAPAGASPARPASSSTSTTSTASAARRR